MGESEAKKKSAHVVLRMSPLEILASSIAVTNCRNLLELFVPSTPEREEVLHHLNLLLVRLNHLERQGCPEEEARDIQLSFEEATVLSKAIDTYFLLEQHQRLLFLHKRLTSGDVKLHLLAILGR